MFWAPQILLTRGFDVYRGVRSWSGASMSRHTYCGSLGHTSEDETGLVYMRARYYDPTVGSFISEEPGRNGGNWLRCLEESPAD